MSALLVVLWKGRQKYKDPLLQVPKGLTQHTAKGLSKATKYTKYNDDPLTVQMQKRIIDNKLVLPFEKW